MVYTNLVRRRKKTWIDWYFQCWAGDINKLAMFTFLTTQRHFWIYLGHVGAWDKGKPNPVSCNLILADKIWSNVWHMYMDLSLLFVLALVWLMVFVVHGLLFLQWHEGVDHFCGNNEHCIFIRVPSCYVLEEHPSRDPVRFLLECLLVMCWKNILREILLGLNVTNVSFLNKLRGEYIDKIQYMFQNISFRGVWLMALHLISAWVQYTLLETFMLPSE